MALAPYQPKEVVVAARAIERTEDKARILVALVPHIAEEDRVQVLKEALTAAHMIADRIEVFNVLIALVPCLTEQSRELALQQALTTVRTIKDSEDQAAGLKTLAPYEPEAVLAAALATKDSGLQLQVLGRVVS